MSQPPPKRVPSVVNSRNTSLQRLRQLSHVLDNAIPIPGTGYRIGLDPLLGLLPGAGDTVAGALSAYIVVEAARMGVPREILLRMASNIVLEVVLGSVPMLGDVFDATWKANARNIALLETHVDMPQPSRGSDRKFLILLILGLAVVIIGFATFSVLLVRLLIGAIGGG
ncbi:DUF4112 domain-containing protein [Leptolyngbya sp. FACHB-541]|uniref:DUF4112 domain-containing protein n=1 Tax=Leptolyngbya sp. FACHB-541 TaxID=2692810 RepID=UPI001683CA3B|nr:DUF4112 domain-containing protein [Leptolyngbya sp. FACHB-541]MBD1999688.1 DUF4112 domain-containing protein [Leptolyngbya sp. FACHB-541]